MATAAAIEKKIEVLRVALERAMQRERSGVVAKIRAAMEAYSITGAELAPKKPRKMKRRLKIKYQTPDGRLTWSGMGRKPGWIVEALAKHGSLDSYKVPV